MTGTRARSPADMAKVNKSMLLPEQLNAQLQDHEQRTGATFTRQAIAALLQYLYSRADGPDPRWMEFAIALDRGKLSLEQVYNRYLDQELEWTAEWVKRLGAVAEPHKKGKRPKGANQTYEESVRGLVSADFARAMRAINAAKRRHAK